MTPTNTRRPTPAAARLEIPKIHPYAMPTAIDLPPNVAQWRPDATRAVLLIHDMQRYFVDFFPRGRPPMTDLVANIVRLRGISDRQGIPVIYTAQPGGMTQLERGLLQDFWGAGMGQGNEREIIDELAPRTEDVVLTRWRYSAFHRSGLEGLLAEWGRDQLIICGVYAHVGCMITACDAFNRDIQPFLVADALADFDRDSHDLAINYAARRCAVTTLTARLVRGLQRSHLARPPSPISEKGVFGTTSRRKS